MSDGVEVRRFIEKHRNPETGEVNPADAFEQGQVDGRFMICNRFFHSEDQVARIANLRDRLGTNWRAWFKRDPNERYSLLFLGDRRAEIPAAYVEDDTHDVVESEYVRGCAEGVLEVWDGDSPYVSAHTVKRGTPPGGARTLTYGK